MLFHEVQSFCNLSNSTLITEGRPPLRDVKFIILS